MAFKKFLLKLYCSNIMMLNCIEGTSNFKTSLNKPALSLFH